MTELTCNMILNLQLQRAKDISPDERMKINFQLALIGCDHIWPKGKSAIIFVDLGKLCRICYEYLQ